MKRNEYYDSPEFQELLNRYEGSMSQSKVCYMEPEEFADIADYYLSRVDSADETLRCVNTGLEQHANDEVLLSIKSATYIYKHEYADALDILDNLDDSFNDVYYQKAQIEYAYFLNNEKADEMFHTWVEREEQEAVEDPEDEREDRIRDAYVHVVSSYIELRPDEGYDEETIKLWVEEYILKFSPLGDYDPDLMLADIVREEGMVDMVERLYTLILQNHPYVNMGWAVLSAAQLTLGHTDEALESANFAMDIAPELPASKLSKAHVLYAQNRYDEAFPLIAQYLDATDDASQYVLMAMVLCRLERFEEALGYADKACLYFDENYKDDPNCSNTNIYEMSNYEVAEAYYLAGDLITASERLDIALDRYPDNPDYLALQGSILLANNQLEESIEVFGKFIDVTDDKVNSIAYVATRYLLAEQYRVSLMLLDMAEQYRSDSPAKNLIVAYRSAVYYQMGNYDDFLKTLKTAVEVCPEVLNDVFATVFPESLPPKDYYEYAKNKYQTWKVSKN